MSYQLLQELLPLLEAYERSATAPPDLAGFRTWLTGAGQTPVSPPERMDIYSSVSKHLFFMVRYAKFYGKKALEGTPLNNLDDFVYLITLRFSGAMGKSELIQMNRHEKPTGMEIIRRLLRSGFVRQSDNPDDRRGKRLEITEAGNGVVRLLYERMEQLGRVVAADLSPAELEQLHFLLTKMEHFHLELQNKARDRAFDELFAAYNDLLPA